MVLAESLAPQAPCGSQLQGVGCDPCLSCSIGGYPRALWVETWSRTVGLWGEDGLLNRVVPEEPLATAAPQPLPLPKPCLLRLGGKLSRPWVKETEPRFKQLRDLSRASPQASKGASPLSPLRGALRTIKRYPAVPPPSPWLLFPDRQLDEVREIWI